MDRSDLGEFGASLSEGELARALAGFVALVPRLWVPISLSQRPDMKLAVDQLRDIFSQEICSVPWYWFSAATRMTQADGRLLADAWRRVVGHRENPVRFELEYDSAAETFWLAEQLLHPDVGASSVYHRVDLPDWPVAWEWPLRLGVLGDRRLDCNRELFQALDRVHHRNLWRIVDVHVPGTECELLLIPGDQRSALAALHDAPHRPRADCVVILDSVERDASQIASLNGLIRLRARAAGVALLRAGNQLAIVLNELVAELSHNKTLDVALADAIRNTRIGAMVSTSSPHLTCSRALATQTSVRLAAARLARDFSPRRLARSELLESRGLEVAAGSPGFFPSIDVSLEAQHVPAALRSDESLIPPYHLQRLARSGQWKSESAGASELVYLREMTESMIGRSHRSPRVFESEESPQPRVGEDLRAVLTDVYRGNDESAAKVMAADQQYTLRVRIAMPDGDSVSAGAAFPSYMLPASPDGGHTLQVSFVPLVADGRGQREPTQQARLFLPSVGASEGDCRFSFTTRGIEKSYRARLLISYENTILQTLRMDASLDGETPYALAVENMVHSGFHNLAYRLPFDAALVVNHSVEGQPGVTTLVGRTVQFGQPQGMAQAIQALQETLTNNTGLRQAECDLNSEPMCKLIYGLMQLGRVLYDEVESLVGELDKDASRIQIVEARAGAAFPVEYLYPLEVPAERPPMCPNAGNALKGDVNGVGHQTCEHRDDPEHMCPLRFWGFRKQVERQPADILPTSPNGDMTTLAVPGALSGRLDLLVSAQVARSKKVQAADFDPPTGLLEVLNKHCLKVVPVSTWQQWKDSVKQGSPGLLLLLSHSDTDGSSNLPALEIGDTKLPLASIEPSYVKGPQAAAPVVFLLGCDTADPTLGFMNFVSRFKRKQAALVVGTLSTISGQRAARFMAGALPLFKAAQGSGRTFGDVFLQVKRSALADGDGFALSLVAYGDTSWQL